MKKFFNIVSERLITMAPYFVLWLLDAWWLKLSLGQYLTVLTLFAASNILSLREGFGAGFDCHRKAVLREIEKRFGEKQA